MSKYRFKTKEEFIRDGLWRENHPYIWNSGGNMNKYLGQDIPEEFNDKCDRGVGFNYEGWSFSSNNYVLKETLVDMEAIQEEAKKRFPIGCRFKNTNGNSYTLKKDDIVYEIHRTSIWAHDSCGCLYKDGKWAELISLPEPVSLNEFKKGDYIVTLDVESGGWNCARNNYCFKQRVDNKGIYPVVDLGGSKTNGHDIMSFDKQKYLKDWRYATPEEIAEYDRIGKPYDVTTLQKKEEYIPQVWDYLVMESKSPLEICRQKYKKGMVVQSAQESGMYSGTFTINANPEEFRITGEEVDYFGSEGFLYLEGKYAEILSYPDEQSKLEYSNSEDSVLNKITIQKETFIENVQSVNVMLRTKKKSIKF